MSGGSALQWAVLLGLQIVRRQKPKYFLQRTTAMLPSAYRVHQGVQLSDEFYDAAYASLGVGL